jgi:hypothetical protein
MLLDALKYRKNVVTTTAGARAECLVGGKKALFDGLLRSDASTPVMPTTITTAKTPIYGSPYSVVSAGTFQTIEDANVGSVLGQRRIKLSTGGIATASALAAPYGSWFAIGRTGAGSGLLIGISCRDNTVSVSSTVGIALYMSGTDLILRSMAGASVWTAAGWVPNNVVYRFWASRDLSSNLTVWTRGGAYTTWTLVVPTAGSTNPFVFGTGYTQQYVGFTRFAGTDCQFGGVIHYITAMTPQEAIAVGILEP